MIRITVGFDTREAVAYHTFCQSILERASCPVSFTPLILSSLQGYEDTHTDGSNSFIYSRFLTPSLFEFKGWAIFADGDMICMDDINKLWQLRDPSKAVMCVKHDYKTVAAEKYLGNKNQDYPRKNWSSLVLWNCEHSANKILTKEFVMQQTGAFLHRFTWLSDNLVGEIPKEWNWLITEYPNNQEAKLLHYTLGTPCFNDYWNCEMSTHWHEAYTRANNGMKV